MDKVSFYGEIAKNKRKSIFLTILVGIVLVGLFYAIGIMYDPSIAILFLLFGAVITIIHIYISYSYGDQIVLKTTNAVPANERTNRYIIDTAEGLAIAAGIPAPKVHIVDSKEINAFALPSTG